MRDFNKSPFFLPTLKVLKYFNNTILTSVVDVAPEYS